MFAGWTGREESKTDKYTQAGYHSPEGTVAVTNLGRNNIHVSLLTPVKEAWKAYATIYCDFWVWFHVYSFYKNSNIKALFLDFITGELIQHFLFLYQGTRNTSMQCDTGLFLMWYVIDMQIRLSLFCCKMWTSQKPNLAFTGNVCEDNARYSRPPLCEIAGETISYIPLILCISVHLKDQSSLHLLR